VGAATEALSLELVVVLVNTKEGLNIADAGCRGGMWICLGTVVEAAASEAVDVVVVTRPANDTSEGSSLTRYPKLGEKSPLNR
jgi:hypothetical protein